MVSEDEKKRLSSDLIPIVLARSNLQNIKQ